MLKSPCDPFRREELSLTVEAAFNSLWHCVREFKIKKVRGCRIPSNVSCTLNTIDPPVVSIIVPFYNQIPATKMCINSLFSTLCDVSAEIILVDDASPDAASAEIARIEGVRLHRNSKNLGFNGACNAGAALARGKFLVFLNNDTHVCENWLEPLLEPFSDYKNVGLVGAKLVYPDGRLQEAGGLIWRDGSGCNFGKFCNPDRPEYNYLRDVDYCSGACVAVPRQLFEELGGFDQHFSPAYYEDTDLAFRIRARGLRTVYQPLSQIIHYEGLTSGTDIALGEKKHQVTNRIRFLERWGEVLKSRHRAPGRSSTSGTSVSLRPRLLVVDTQFPCPDFDSGSVRMQEMLLAARDAGYDVIFHCIEQTNNTPQRRHFLQSQGIQVLYKPWYRNFRQIAMQLGPTLDAVLISRPTNFKLLHRLVRRYSPRAQLIYDTVDLHFLRLEREFVLTGNAKVAKRADVYRSIEAESARKADLTLVVSSSEVPLLQAISPGATIKVLSNIHSLVDDPPPFCERDGMAFVGGYHHGPNVDAVRYFIESVFPLVRKSIPDAVFRIIGSNPPPELLKLKSDGIEILGYVEDIDPVLARTRIMVAPLRYGAGVKGKVNTAMSHGLPVVATTIAVEGMGMCHDVDVLIGDTPEAIASEIVQLYRSEVLWTRIAEGAKTTLVRNFSRDLAIKVFESTLAKGRPR